MSRVDMHKAMRFKGQSTPMTAAERQRLCRARKRGERIYACTVDEARAAGLLPPANPNPALPAPQKQTPAFSAPTQSQPVLPAPSSTAIQKSSSSGGTWLAQYEGEEPGDAPRLCLPPAVAARLRSLLDKHKAGKHLTAAERAEAEGLLDIAEYFVVHRMRRQLAA